MFGLQLGRMGAIGGPSLEAQVAAMFGAGAVGGVVSPADYLTTMWQDLARATPAAIGQPIGSALLKYSGGIYAAQPTSGSRPVLSVRVNLLTKTENFDDVIWIKGGTAAPASARVLNFPATGAVFSQNGITPAGIGSAATASFLLSGTGTMSIGVARAGSGTYEQTAKQVTLTATPTKHAVTHTIINSGQSGFLPFLSRAAATSDTAVSVAVDSAQLEIGTVDTRYQRVDTASDYDTIGFPIRAQFDSVDDAMLTTFAVALGSNCTVVRSVPGVGTTILVGQTIGTTYTNTVTHSGLIVIDRPLTAAETAAAARWSNQMAGL